VRPEIYCSRKPRSNRTSSSYNADDKLPVSNNVVFAGAHLGYDTQDHPLGGGAQVGLQLIDRWCRTRPFGLVVVGSGPGKGWEETPGVVYRSVKWYAPGDGPRLTDLSIRGYARFCRRFEQGVTEELQRLAADGGARHTLVLHNDICEAGDYRRISRMGYRQATIFHVDVVDYVASVYLRGLVSARSLARAARALDRFGGLRLTPDVVQLIFLKQEACTRWSDLLIVPSGDMKRVLLEGFPWLTGSDVLVLPWGAMPGPEPTPDSAQARAQLGLPKDQPVALCLSRLSPEKGQDRLLKSLALWEKRGGRPLTLVICGAPAYMHGRRYMRKLRRLAGRLERTDVRFPGYVTGATKQAFLAAADLYVFPSRHESYGLTLMEAMRCGLPVLTTDHRSARELVRPEFGRVVPCSPAALAEGLGELLQEDLSQMGLRAQKFAQGFAFDRVADRLAAEIRSVLH